MSLAFEKAFEKCLADGVYPGPSNITERMAPSYRRDNHLNGRLTTLRIELMHKHGVPYQRSTGAFGKKGEVPNPPWAPPGMPDPG